jgi:hypothetical protein
MILGSSSSRRHLVGGEAPHLKSTAFLTAIGPDKTGPSDLLNQSIWFLLFQTLSSDSYSIHVPTHFDDSAGEDRIELRK